MQRIQRREFLFAAIVGVVARALAPGVLEAAPAQQPLPHPTPRRGITAAKLPSRAELADTPEASAVFDLVRQIPGVIDGIRCNCSCAGSSGYRSLLSCYELPDAMAKSCDMCKAQAHLAHRMHTSGKSLREIRKGIDARFA